MKSANNETMGMRIKKMRKKRKISKEKFATLLSTSRSRVDSWEADRDCPNAESLKSIAKALRCSTDYLLFGAYNINWTAIRKINQMAELAKLTKTCISTVCSTICLWKDIVKKACIDAFQRMAIISLHTIGDLFSCNLLKNRTRKDDVSNKENNTQSINGTNDFNQTFRQKFYYTFLVTSNKRFVLGWVVFLILLELSNLLGELTGFSVPINCYIFILAAIGLFAFDDKYDTPKYLSFQNSGLISKRDSSMNLVLNMLCVCVVLELRFSVKMPYLS